MPTQEELEKFVQACRDQFEIGNPNATIFPIAKSFDIMVAIILHLEVVSDDFTGGDADISGVLHQLLANRAR